MMPGSGGGVALAAGAAGLALPEAAAEPAEVAGLGAVPAEAVSWAMPAEVAGAEEALAAAALVFAVVAGAATGAVEKGADTARLVDVAGAAAAGARRAAGMSVALSSVKVIWPSG
jgi:hypothetical protein